MIGIIDYGSGNFTSVYNAFSSVSSDVIVITNEKDFNKCSHIVLPGVGSFGSSMAKLKEMDILEGLYESVIVKKMPFLGICVGMQLLADTGYEFGEYGGLGYVNGKVVRLDLDESNYNLPHMGWNNLLNTANSPLFKGIDQDADFYFVHSYHFELKDKNRPTVGVFYGREFVAAFSFENIHGVQFHPEKSQYHGLKLLENFVGLKD